MNLLPRCAILLCLLAAPVLADEPPKRVVVFGLDGADFEVFDGLYRAGKLPNFQALAAKGSFAPLATTNPAQSPVSWASFSTGSNPGKTSIYDFLRRDPDRPGLIEIAFATKDWVDGPIGKGWRVLLPLLAGILVGFLLRRLLRGKRACMVVGVLAALVVAACAHVVLGWIPARYPKATSNRLGIPLWTVLGEAGIPSVVVEAPLSFPADRARNLRLLSGLGTPDVQGAWGYYSVFTEDAKSEVVTETSGFVDAVAFDADGVARSRVYGPPNITLDEAELKALEREAALAKNVFEMKIGVPSAKRAEERAWQHAERAKQASCPLEIRRDAVARTATIRAGSGEPVVLKEHAWSDYVPFEFRMNPIVKVRGIGKFWLESTTPFRLILNPVSFDPRDVPPIVDVSFPRDFAPSLAAKAGAYDLVGWPCLTNPIKDSMLTDEAFIAHVRGITAERRAKLKAAMAGPDWRFLFVMFSEVDRVQHAFWRHIDPKSPLHDAAAAAKYGPAIAETYVAMDAVLGDILAAAGPDTTVLVMSDHGFAPFRRSVSLNTWLLKAGFMHGAVGRDMKVADIFSGRNFFAGLDTERTKAYAVGIGGIYVNLKGREAKGCVDPKDYDAVCAEIRRGLLELRDTDGTKVVREVYLGKDIYHGPTAAAHAPDLVVGFEKGYRVSWQTTLGGGAEDVIEDNRFPWSGDHCSVDPSLVPGILLSNRPLRTEGASVLDIAPTVLDLFGVKAPPEWDGKSLLPR